MIANTRQLKSHSSARMSGRLFIQTVLKSVKERCAISILFLHYFVQYYTEISRFSTLVIQIILFTLLVHKKNNFCKILVKNTYLALVNLKANHAKFLQQSCNSFSFLAKVLQELCFLNLARNAFFCKNLARSCKK